MHILQATLFLLASPAVLGTPELKKSVYKFTDTATKNYTTTYNVDNKGAFNNAFNSLPVKCSATAIDGSCLDSAGSGDFSQAVANCCEEALKKAFDQVGTDGTEDGTASGTIERLTTEIYSKCKVTDPSFVNNVRVEYQCPFLTCNPDYWKETKQTTTEEVGMNDLRKTISASINNAGAANSAEVMYASANQAWAFMGYAIRQYSLYEAYESIVECMLVSSEDSSAIDKAVAFYVGLSTAQSGDSQPYNNAKQLQSSLDNWSFNEVDDEAKQVGNLLAEAYNTISDAVNSTGISGSTCSGEYPSGETIPPLGSPSEAAKLFFKMNSIEGIQNSMYIRNLVNNLDILSTTTDELNYDTARGQVVYLLKVIGITYAECDKFLYSIIPSDSNTYPDSATDIPAIPETLSQMNSYRDNTNGSWFTNYAIPTITNRVYSNLRCLHIEDCAQEVGEFTSQKTSTTYKCEDLGLPAKGEANTRLGKVRNYQVTSSVDEHSYMDLDQQFSVNCMKRAGSDVDEEYGKDFFFAQQTYGFGQFSKGRDGKRSMRNMAVKSKAVQLNPEFNFQAYQLYTSNSADNFGISNGDSAKLIPNRWGDYITQNAYNMKSGALIDMDKTTRYEMSSKIQQYTTLNSYVQREGYDMLYDCEREATSGNDQSLLSVKAVDEAVMFATGWKSQDSFTGYDSSTNSFSIPNNFANAVNVTKTYADSTWCALAGKYNPLPGDGDSPRFNGTQNACSALDNESFISLQEEIQKYVKCRNGELGGETCKTIYSSENNVTCSEGLSQKLERVGQKILIPYIQGLLRYAYKADPRITAWNKVPDATEYSAEAFAFAAPLRAPFTQCDPATAGIIFNSLRYQFERTTNGGAQVFDSYASCDPTETVCQPAAEYLGAQNLWALIYGMLPCLGLTCEEVGTSVESFFPNGKDGVFNADNGGLLPSCQDIIGENPRPTPIQGSQNANADDNNIYAQYVGTSTNVQQHSRVSLDIKDLVLAINNENYTEFETIWNDGQNSQKSDRLRTLSGLSTKDISAPLGEFTMPTYYAANGADDFSETRILALAKKCIEDPLTSTERSQCANMVGEAIVLTVVGPYVDHEMEDCWNDCTDGQPKNNADSVKACNEALAFYSGWQQPFDRPQIWSVYSSAEVTARHFYDDLFNNQGRAGVNNQAMFAFEGSENAINDYNETSTDNTTTTCAVVRTTVRMVEEAQTTGLIRHFIKYLLYEGPNDSPPDVAFENMRSAQLLLYASLWQCDPEGAEFFKTIDDKTLYAIHWSTGGLKQGASQEEKKQFIKRVESYVNVLYRNAQCIGLTWCPIVGPALSYMGSSTLQSTAPARTGSIEYTDSPFSIEVGTPGTPNTGFEINIPICGGGGAAGTIAPNPNTCKVQCKIDIGTMDIDSCNSAYDQPIQSLNNPEVCFPSTPVKIEVTSGNNPYKYDYTFTTNQANNLLLDTDSLSFANFVGKSKFNDAGGVYTQGRSVFETLCNTVTEDPVECAERANSFSSPLIPYDTWSNLQTINSGDYAGLTFPWQTENGIFYEQLNTANNGITITGTPLDGTNPKEYANTVITKSLTDSSLYTNFGWNDDTREQVAKKTVQASGTTAALGWVQNTENRLCSLTEDVSGDPEAATSWDTTASYIFGSILVNAKYTETPDPLPNLPEPNALKGQFMGYFAVKRESERTNITDPVSGTIQNKLKEIQQIIFHPPGLTPGLKCDTIKGVNQDLTKKFVAPFYMGTQKYALACSNKDNPCSAKAAGEMMAFTLVASPKLYACDNDAGNFVFAQTNIFQEKSEIMSYGYAALQGAFEKNFECLGFNCDTVGSVSTDYPCGASSNIEAFNSALAQWKASLPTDSPASAVKVGVISIVVMVASLFLAF